MCFIKIWPVWVGLKDLQLLITSMLVITNMGNDIPLENKFVFLRGIKCSLPFIGELSNNWKRCY